MKFTNISILLSSIAITAPAIAQAPSPAVAIIQSFSDALIATMRAGPSLGFAGRMARLTPVIDRSFDLPLTTRLAVGPPWTTISAADQAALAAAIRRMTIAEYAKNFASWNGESITVDDRANIRATDALVRTTLARRGGEPVAIAYRLRQSGGSWRIIDVLFNGSVSQLATRRSDYARILASGGARALIRHLDTATANASR